MGQLNINACVSRTYYWYKKERSRKNNSREEEFSWKLLLSGIKEIELTNARLESGDYSLFKWPELDTDTISKGNL